MALRWTGWANNRVENSHLAFPRRERDALLQAEALQKFASVHASCMYHGMKRQGLRPPDHHRG